LTKASDCEAQDMMNGLCILLCIVLQYSTEGFGRQILHSNGYFVIHWQTDIYTY